MCRFITCYTNDGAEFGSSHIEDRAMSKYFEKTRYNNGAFGRLIFWAILSMFIVGGGSPSTFASGTGEPHQTQEITVYKSPQCGCCTKWVEHLEANGIEVDVITVSDTASVKQRVGVPRQFSSCHTAVVGDYWVEGHVPADLIQRLLAEHPDNIKGIAVPGMPLGSPGMEGPNPMEYEILSVDVQGNVAVYAKRMGESSP